MHGPFFLWKYGEYFRASVEAPTYRIVFELGLIILVFYLLFKKKYRLNEELTYQEEEELIKEWTPTPLFLPCKEMETVVVNGKGKRSTINGKECLNFGSYNFCDLNNEDDGAIQALAECGTGSCGPRGFYGTIECHLKLEEKIAEWMGADAAILYSVSCCVISSVIPSCVYSGDSLFLDESCSEWIAYGAKISRAKIYFYRHNDWAHLEELLSICPPSKKFIVAEGVNQKLFDIVDLPKLIELKYTYKARIILDESLSVGVIAPKGVIQLSGCSILDVDMMILSLENSFASLGGLCLGHSSIIHHQRLAGHAYCFSASSPPFTVQPIFSRLSLLQEQWRFDTLFDLSSYLRDRLALELPQFEFGGDQGVPVIIMKHVDIELMEYIVREGRNRGIAIVMMHRQTPYYPQMVRLPPCIKITLNCSMEISDLDILVDTVKELSYQDKSCLFNSI